MNHAANITQTDVHVRPDDKFARDERFNFCTSLPRQGNKPMNDRGGKSSPCIGGNKLYSARLLHAQNSLILHFAATPTMPRKNHTYSMRVKRDVLDVLRQHSKRAVARRYNIPRRSLCYWIGQEYNIRGFAAHERSKSRKRGGVQSIPFPGHLLMYFLRIFKFGAHKDHACILMICALY